MDKPHKNLHIVNIPWYSGLAAYAQDLAVSLKSENNEEVFAVVAPSKLSEEINNEYRIIGLKGRGIRSFIGSIKRIMSFSPEFNYVFAYTGSAFFIAVILKILRKCRYVVRIRPQAGTIKNNFFNNLLHSKADLVIAPTEKIRNDFLELGVNEGKIFVLPPVVDTEKYRFSDLPEKNILALIGRASDVKGHDIFIKSLPEIIKEIPDLKVVFAGTSNKGQWERIRNIAEDYGVNNLIEYRGYVKNEVLVEIICQSKIGVIPSKGSEAVSRVALEFMSSGRPVIASRVGMLEELIKDNVNGILVIPERPDDLAEKSVALIKDPDKAKKIALNARKTVEEGFSPKIFKEKLNEAIQRITG